MTPALIDRARYQSYSYISTVSPPNTKSMCCHSGGHCHLTVDHCTDGDGWIRIAFSREPSRHWYCWKLKYLIQNTEPCQFRSTIWRDAGKVKLKDGYLVSMLCFAVKAVCWIIAFAHVTDPFMHSLNARRCRSIVLYDDYMSVTMFVWRRRYRYMFGLFRGQKRHGCS